MVPNMFVIQTRNPRCLSFPFSQLHHCGHKSSSLYCHSVFPTCLFLPTLFPFHLCFGSSFPVCWYFLAKITNRITWKDLSCLENLWSQTSYLFLSVHVFYLSFLDNAALGYYTYIELLTTIYCIQFGVKNVYSQIFSLLRDCMSSRIKKKKSIMIHLAVCNKWKKITFKSPLFVLFNWFKCDLACGLSLKNCGVTLNGMSDPYMPYNPIPDSLDYNLASTHFGLYYFTTMFMKLRTS